MNDRWMPAICGGLFLALLTPRSVIAAEAFVRESKLFYQAHAGAPAVELLGDRTLQTAALSPDGRWIIYQSVHQGMILDGGNGQVVTVSTHVMRTDGSRVQLLSRDSPIVGSPVAPADLLPTLAYTADKKAFYFTGEDFHVYRFQLATGQRIRLCEGRFEGLFSRGKWAGLPMVWRAIAEKASTSQLWIVDADGRPLRELTQDEIAELPSSR